ncbi:hypothetical protein RL2479 [Rhizobium johnstonii 3841]|uniref:Uncharacterized protein n=2 Tax=Rhizobium TaxID=379 RepID=Q1MGF5_RHIJ3|nr:hypothetical protein RL2479 [Rhizobium johnstonii 3841]
MSATGFEGLDLWRITMNDETIMQLDTISQQLHARSRALSQLDNDNDIAILMSALAATMEAVRSLCEDMNQLNGPKGLGSDGH